MKRPKTKLTAGETQYSKAHKALRNKRLSPANRKALASKHLRQAYASAFKAFQRIKTRKQTVKEALDEAIREGHQGRAIQLDEMLNQLNARHRELLEVQKLVRATAQQHGLNISKRRNVSYSKTRCYFCFDWSYYNIGIEYY